MAIPVFLCNYRQRQLDPIPDLLSKFMTQVEGLTDPANAKRASADASSAAGKGGKGGKGGSRGKRKSHVGAPPKDDAVLTDVNVRPDMIMTHRCPIVGPSLAHTRWILTAAC